jgi:hypothetical protein
MNFNFRKEFKTVFANKIVKNHSELQNMKLKVCSNLNLKIVFVWSHAEFRKMEQKEIFIFILLQNLLTNFVTEIELESLYF